MNNQLIISHQENKSPVAVIKEAMVGVKVKDSTMEELAIALSAAIEKGCFYLGLNKSSDDKTAMKIIVIEDCTTSFRDLSLSEIKIAIDNGVKGQYGEVRGMAPKDVYHWISSYRTSEIRKNIVKDAMYSRGAEETISGPTEEEKIQLAMYTIEQAWVKFKETGGYSDHGNTVYNILDANGKIKLSKDEKQDCLQNAKAYLLNYYAPEKHIGNDIKLKEVLKIYNEIKESDSNIRLKSQAKQFALLMVFEQMKKENIEIYDLFN